MSILIIFFNFFILLQFFIVIHATNPNCSSTGLHISVWKKHGGSALNHWIEQNIVSVIRKMEESKSSDESSMVCNTIQPQLTNDYMNFAEILVKEHSLDLFDVDIVYPGRFRKYTSDLTDYSQFDDLRAWLDKDLEKAYSSSDGKSLLAFPWFKEHGVLIWRKDLLKKHGYDENEPLSSDFTWERMAHIAADIQSKESQLTDGYAWQGNNYEGLTCNVMEWIASDGVTSRIIDDDKITLVVNETTVKSFERVASWIGTITSKDVIEGDEMTVKNKFETGKALFVRLWSGMYDGVAKAVAENNKKDGTTWDIGVSFMPKGNVMKAATLGGWGLSVSNFNKESSNYCRKKNALTALNWMVNLTAQKAFYKQFQRNPTFNSTFIDELCNESDEFQIVCELNKQKKASVNPKPKLFSRPDVSFNYRLKSEVIYDFVQTFIEFYVNHESYDQILKELKVNNGPKYTSPTNISDAGTMLNRMICVLNSELSKDTMVKNDIVESNRLPCQCGKSEYCSRNDDYYYPNGKSDEENRFLTYVKRTENNNFFYPGDQFCSNQNNFTHNLVKTFGYLLVAIIYALCISLFAWIMMNLKNRVVNHSQPIFLVLVLIGVSLNTSTIIPFLMDERSVEGCTPNKDNVVVDFQEKCQEPLDTACRSLPFTYMYGFVITFSALLVKLWRVEKIFNNTQLRRLRINMCHLYSLIGCFLVLITIINAFLVTNPSALIGGQGFTWWRLRVTERRDTLCNKLPPLNKDKNMNFCDNYLSKMSISSFGMCRFAQTSCIHSNAGSMISSGMIAILLDAALMIIFLLYSMYISIKTREIKTSYNEGKFILISLVNQFQLSIVGAAIVTKLSEVQSGDPTYFALAIICIISFSNLSTILLIFLPKLIVWYSPKLARRLSIGGQNPSKAEPGTSSVALSKPTVFDDEDTTEVANPAFDIRASTTNIR
jgi:trehalose/maltose transport system substrate-binding protein